VLFAKMRADDLVRIEIQHLAGEMALEVSVELPPTHLSCHVRGTTITWQAEGIRITVPAASAEVLRETLARLTERTAANQHHAPK
jgi:hypothetical protein